MQGGSIQRSCDGKQRMKQLHASLHSKTPNTYRQPTTCHPSIGQSQRQKLPNPPPLSSRCHKSGRPFKTTSRKSHPHISRPSTAATRHVDTCLLTVEVWIKSSFLFLLFLILNFPYKSKPKTFHYTLFADNQSHYLSETKNRRRKPDFALSLALFFLPSFISFHLVFGPFFFFNFRPWL